MRDHPDIPEYRLEISNSYGNLGNVLRRRKDHAGAERAFRQALEQNGWLKERFPGEPGYLLRKGADEGNIAMVLSERGEKEESLQWFTVSLDQLLWPDPLQNVSVHKGDIVYVPMSAIGEFGYIISRLNPFSWVFLATTIK